MRSRLLLLLATAALTAASACSNDTNAPAGLASAYKATSFTLQQSGAPTVDVLAAGATLDITLSVDHTTSGRLTVPASVAGGAALDESLAGTWRSSHDTVYFDGPADTFVRDVPFAVRGSTLVADEQAPGLRLQLTLTRQ